MKKIYSTKIFKVIIVAMILIASLSIAFFSSRAEDNNEERDNQYEDYRPAVTAPPLSSPLPVITSSQNSNSNQNSNLNALGAFRDSDQDGIPDVIDRHPGEDDFSYSLIDSNNNGIADDLEILIK